MIHVVLVFAGLLVVQTADKPQLPADLKTYEGLKLKAGAIPEAEVKLCSGARLTAWAPSG